jgi:hypothetical protein
MNVYLNVPFNHKNVMDNVPDKGEDVKDVFERQLPTQPYKMDFL